MSGGQISLAVNGIVGPRGDGYKPDTQMRADEAEAYHSSQIKAFKEAGADLVSAMTMNTVEESSGSCGPRSRSAFRWQSPSRSKRTGNWPAAAR